MKATRLIYLLLALAIALQAAASRVDTIAVASPAMKKDVAVAVVTPDGRDGQRLPVVYLLHGYGDNHLNGYLQRTNVRELVDQLGVIAVIPDGGTSWYFDSPVDPSCRYETFVAKELVAAIDSTYPTIPDRAHRAVTGLSMGGHGALYLAIRHQDTFGAAGSMSGGVDFLPFPGKWNLSKRLGDIADHPDNWERNTVMAQLPLLADGSLALIIDCGTSDFFFPMNVSLHEALAERGVAHEFTTRPGTHNWTYWRRSLRDHLFFFSDFFSAER